MYGPTLSTEIIAAIFLRFEELLRKAGKMDMFETLVYNYRLKENLPYQCLQHFAVMLNDLIRQLTELSVALEAGTHMSQSPHKSDYECGPECEAVVNRFCLMESLLENNDLTDFTMDCAETEICETVEHEAADLIDETVAILGESNILIPSHETDVGSPLHDNSSIYSGQNIQLPLSNSNSTITISDIPEGAMADLNKNDYNSLSDEIETLECTQNFLAQRGYNADSEHVTQIQQNIRTSSTFAHHKTTFVAKAQSKSTIHCDEAVVNVSQKLINVRTQNNSKALDPRTTPSEIPKIHIGKNITFQQPKPVQCRQCGKTFLTEKGLKSHESLTHKKSPEAIAQQRKEEELILKKIGVLTGVGGELSTNVSSTEFTVNIKGVNAKERTKKEPQSKTGETRTGKGINFKPPDLVQCHQCGKTFLTEKGLKSHEGLVHKKISEESIENSNESPQIKKITTQLIPSQCKICGKTFMTEKGLKSHEGLVHKKPGDKDRLKSHINTFLNTPHSINKHEFVNQRGEIYDSGESQGESRKSKVKKRPHSVPIAVCGTIKREKNPSFQTTTEQLQEKSPFVIRKQSKVNPSLNKMIKPNEENGEEKAIPLKKAKTSDRSPVSQILEKAKAKKETIPKGSHQLKNSPINLHSKSQQIKAKKPNEEEESDETRIVRHIGTRMGLRKRESSKVCDNPPNTTPSNKTFTSKQSKSVKEEIINIISEGEQSSDSKTDDSNNEFPSWVVCEKCVLVFKTVQDFQDHYCSFMGDKCELQEFCHKRYIQNKGKLNTMRKFVCSICAEEFRSYQRICYHMNKCEVGPYFCEICPSATPPFDSMKLLNSHKRTEHREQNSYICNECGHSFKYKNSLNKHKVQVHELNPTPQVFKCEFCKEEFKKKVVFTNHKIQVHGQERLFLCQICGSRFSSFASLMAHHATTHEGKKKFQCSYCEKTFPRKDKLLHHEATHTGEKFFCCDVCGKRFVRKIRLDDHRRRHAAERRFCCMEFDCAKLFASKPDLNNHMKRHVAEKKRIEMVRKEKEIFESTSDCKPSCENKPAIKPKLVKEMDPMNAIQLTSIQNNSVLDDTVSLDSSALCNRLPSQSYLSESPENISTQSIQSAENEGEFFMMLDPPDTTADISNEVTRHAITPQLEQEIFQMNFSASTVYASHQQYPQSSSTLYQGSDSLMDAGELDSHLYSSQIEDGIQLSLDEDAKALNNNLKELSDMIAQEMSFDTTLC